MQRLRPSSQLTPGGPDVGPDEVEQVHVGAARRLLSGAEVLQESEQLL